MYNNKQRKPFRHGTNSGGFKHTLYSRPAGQSSGRPQHGYSGRPQHSNQGRTHNQPRPAQGKRKILAFDPHNLIANIPAEKAPVGQVAHRTMPLADLRIDQRLKQTMLNRGYTTLTPVQTLAIPMILEGKEVVGLANTGTGKTAAFLVPIINNLLSSAQPFKTLVIVPTRELANQIQDELKALTPGLRIYSAVVIGGASQHRQVQDLRRNPQFVIGTPGRLKDLNQQGFIKFDSLRYFVLDEADRMLDMGFVGDIRKILGQKRPESRTLFFSATIDERVKGLLKEFSKDPQIISVRTAETAGTIEQSVQHFNTDDEKLEKLAEMLKKPDFSKTLIFVRTKHGADKLTRKLERSGLRIDAIHGNKRQGQRERTLMAYRNNRINHLVATDVAARGLDISNVSHVINYDAPATKEDYVHRIGRTGRAGNTGKAITFVKRA